MLKSGAEKKGGKGGKRFERSDSEWGLRKECGSRSKFWVSEIQKINIFADGKI